VIDMPRWGFAAGAGLVAVALGLFTALGATHESVFMLASVVGMAIVLVQLFVLTPMLGSRTARLPGFGFELAPIAAAIVPLAPPVAVLVGIMLFI
jgi:hypothetical protein